MATLTYTNAKSREVRAEVTVHAMGQFRWRWRVANPGVPDPTDWDLEMEAQFARCSRVKNLGRKERTRLDRHGRDTLYFRNTSFTFVVQDAAVLTVELSASDLRPENRLPVSKRPEPFDPSKRTPKLRLSLLVRVQGRAVPVVVNAGRWDGNTSSVEAAVSAAIAKRSLDRSVVVGINVFDGERFLYSIGEKSEGARAP